MKTLLPLAVLFFLMIACGNPAPIINKGKNIVKEYLLKEADIFSGGGFKS